MSLIRQCTKPFFSKRIPQCLLYTQNQSFSRHRLWRYYCAGTISHPASDSCNKVYPTKIKNIVEEIAKLTLIEVADLNECLKKTLNIKDAPMMMGALPAAAPVAAEEDDVPQVTKSSFTVKLNSIDPTKKVAIIKEIKSVLEGMNLVQAKKFVESVPQVVKADIAKDEADKLKEVLEKVGGICEIS